MPGAMMPEIRAETVPQTVRDCRLVNTTLAFEYSSVDADVRGTIDSVFNPSSGTYSLKWEEAGDALPMWVADMDFQTAPVIREYRRSVCIRTDRQQTE